MAFWKRSKPQAQDLTDTMPEPPALRGLFAGPVADDGSTTRAAYRKQFQASLARSVQITTADLTPIGPDGQAMDSSLDTGYAAKFGMTGTNVPLQQFDWFASFGFVGWQVAAVMAQHWLVERVCALPGDDAIRHGYEVMANGGQELAPDILEAIRKKDKLHKIKKECASFIKMGRVYGVRHALFLIDGMDYELPFNPDAIRPGSYRGITQIDPYWMAPEFDARAIADPTAQDFYEPTWWRVKGKRIHRSHFVVFRNGGDMGDMLKPSYIYGGVPVPQRIAERVYAAERTANEAPMLAMSKRMTVYSTDAALAMADADRFNARMTAWQNIMNNFGVKVVDKESEEINQFDTALSDFDALIMTQYQLVAAAGGVPATKLLGTQPKGFNATGDYEEASYHELLETIQENEMTPLLDRHYECLVRSFIAPEFGTGNINLEILWNPCDSPTAKEQAETNYVKAQSDALLVGTGALDPQDVRSRIIMDRDSGYSGIEEEIDYGNADFDEPPGQMGSPEKADDGQGDDDKSPGQREEKV